MQAYKCFIMSILICLQKVVKIYIYISFIESVIFEVRYNFSLTIQHILHTFLRIFRVTLQLQCV